MPAVMIPRVFDKVDSDSRAHEQEIFDSLRDNLNEDYKVYHSVKSSFRSNKKNIESEADFIIFNPNKGIIVIEAKYIRGFTIENGVWKDDKGFEIHYGNGPYNQAKTYIGRLKDSIKSVIPNIVGKFPITYIVWFHAMSAAALSEFDTCFDFNFEHTFSKDDLKNPSRRIEKILNEQAVKDGITISLNKSDKKKLEQIMNLNACVFDSKSDVENKEKQYSVLLDEQIHILDFLEFQPLACIQGLGGTGKTVIAVEKAKRCSFDGKTLFLCFNSELNKKLTQENKDYENIFFYSIDSFMGDKTYSDLVDFILGDKFDFKNIIVDEAQDLSHDIAHTEDPAKHKYKKELLDDIFVALKERAIEKNGCFYVFFDKYQCIQSEATSLPEFINKPDCLLTLHVNCRNTIEICKTSTAPLVEGYKGKLPIKHIVNKGVSGDKPSLFVCSNSKSVILQLNNLIDQSISKYGNDVVILTMKTLDTTILTVTKKYDKNKGLFESDSGKKIKVSTIRKFKGLEANVIILVDVTEDTFDISKDTKFEESILLFYVGCSRAKHQLHILSSIDEKKLKFILENCYDVGDAKKSCSELANLLGTKPYNRV